MIIILIYLSIFCVMLVAERFRMVRVGRAEAMHPIACDISSQQLVTRELLRLQAEQPAAPAGLDEEVTTSRLN